MLERTSDYSAALREPQPAQWELWHKACSQKRPTAGRNGEPLCTWCLVGGCPESSKAVSQGHPQLTELPAAGSYEGRPAWQTCVAHPGPAMADTMLQYLLIIKPIGDFKARFQPRFTASRASVFFNARLPYGPQMANKHYLQCQLILIGSSCLSSVLRRILRLLLGSAGSSMTD